MGNILISASVCLVCLLIAALSQLLPMAAWSSPPSTASKVSTSPSERQALASAQRGRWELDPDNPNPALFTMAPESDTVQSPDQPDTTLPMDNDPVSVGGDREENVRITASGLKIIETAVGTGAEAVTGSTVQVHYDGRLESGRDFDSSRKRGEPFQFRLGAGMVIKGWDEGIAGMKEGGRRQLVIPPELGYGTRGAGGVIPPNATLVFDVELLKVVQ